MPVQAAWTVDPGGWGSSLALSFPSSVSGMDHLPIAGLGCLHKIKGLIFILFNGIKKTLSQSPKAIETKAKIS